MIYTVVRNLFCARADFTQLDTFTAEASLTTGATLPQPTIRGTDMEMGVGKTWRIMASGIIGCTGTPTFTFTVRLNTATASIAGAILAQSAAITMQAGVSNQSWFLDVAFTLRTPGSSGTMSIEWAKVESFGGFAAPYGYGMWPGGAASDTWTQTYNSLVDQYISVSATCGTSNAANLVKLKGLVVDEVR